MRLIFGLAALSFCLFDYSAAMAAGKGGAVVPPVPLTEIEETAVMDDTFALDAVPVAPVVAEKPSAQTGVSVESSERSSDIAEINAAWTVKPFSRVSGMPSGECVMSATYSNGFELAFKGKQNRLTAVRIADTKAQDGKTVSGFIGLGIGDNSYGLQSRVKDGMVDASLLTVPAAGEMIKDKQDFRLRVGDKDFYFSSVGFDVGYRQLMECQRRHGLTTLKVVDDSHPIIIENDGKMPSAPRMAVQADQSLMPIPPETISEDNNILVEQGNNNVPLAMALPMLLPSGYSYQFDGTVNPMASVSWDAEGNWQDRLAKAMATQGYAIKIEGNNVKITSGMTPVSVPTDNLPEADNIDDGTYSGHWQANKGDHLVATLKRWADTAGVKTDLRLNNDPVLKQDFHRQGDLNAAVNALLAETGQGEGQQFTAILSDNDQGITPVSQAPAADAGTNGWGAMEGMDLRRVLRGWSMKEGIELVWNTDQRFMVRHPVQRQDGDYADAVAAILQQYEGDVIRPVATLNTDPNTGKKALIINVKG